MDIKIPVKVNLLIGTSDVTVVLITATVSHRFCIVPVDLKAVYISCRGSVPKPPFALFVQCNTVAMVAIVVSEADGAVSFVEVFRALEIQTMTAIFGDIRL